MSYDLELFDKLDSLSTPVYITLSDGSVKNVSLGGNVRLDTNIVLKKVLYVSEFKFNLLSVTKLLADKKLCIHIYPAACIFQDLTTSKVVAVEQEHIGLYTLESSYSSNFKGKRILGKKLQSDHKELEDTAVSSCFTATNKSCNQLPLEVLHARLGHTSLSKMKYISNCKDVPSGTFFCETCILAKAHRLPFGRSVISTKNPFELRHMDLWGPYRIANINGARYFITIVDDYARNTWTQKLLNKTRVPTTIEHFFNMVEIQFKTKVAMVRTDNGS